MGTSIQWADTSSGPWRWTSTEQAMESWPSVKTSASTRTRSPTVRLAGKRPASTAGVMDSMMTRLRPSGGSAVMSGSVRPVYGERRQVSRSAMPGQALIKRDGLVRDRGPAEHLFDAAAAGFAEAAAFLGIVEQNLDAAGEVVGEGCRVGGKAGHAILVEGHEVAGFVVDHHLFDASGGAGYDGGAA